MTERELRLKGKLHSNGMSIEDKIDWLLNWKKVQDGLVKVQSSASTVKSTGSTGGTG